MLAGDPFKRSAGTDFASQAISYNCLDYNGPAKPETGGFPNYNCPDGLRAQVFFPSCWNGKDLDSPDHKSHMSYPADSYNSGKCPPDYPVHLISIFYEIIWDTNAFADQWWGSQQPFVWSMGDDTGYGGHGDFIMGWDRDLLQRAVDTCTNDSGRVEDCAEFNLVPDSQAAGCRIAPKIDEPNSGVLDALPGCNPIQSGPAEAKPVSGCGAPTTIGQAQENFFTDLTAEGWAYVGCGTDDYFNRILTGASESNGQMTNANCVAFCQSKGFSIAGSEYSDECYCGNSIPSSGMPVPGVVGNCQMTCAGDNSQFCGGASLISLYQKCTGSTCTNAQIGAVSNSSPSSSSPSSSASSTNAKGSSTAAGTAASTASSTGTKASTTMTTVKASTSAAVPSVSTPNSGNHVISSASGSQTTAPSGSSKAASSPASTVVSAVSSTNTNVHPPSGWSYAGCWVDTVFPRTLPEWSSFNGPAVNNTRCIDFCNSNGYSIAGTEYAGQCFCGNNLDGSSQTPDSDCNMACTGNANEICGGPARMTVWKKSGSSNQKRNDHAARHLGRARGSRML